MFPRASFSLVAASFLSALSIACGDSQGLAPVPVDFSVSDAPVESLAAVVVTIDRVTINRPGADIVVETFPGANPGDPAVDTITVDLLDYQGMDSKLIVDGLMLEPGSYQNLRLRVLDGDISLTYVMEAGGAIKPLKVPSSELKLGGFDVAIGLAQAFVIEFDLGKATTYNPGPDRYILKPRGVRIVDVEQAALIAGIVDAALFDAGACATKVDPTVGNVVYLYAGHGLPTDALGDHFDPLVDSAAAAQLVEPFASETVAADGSYLFSYLPSGPYTLAFACDAANDDSEVDDGIVIPDPVDQWTELTIQPGEQRPCDFPIVGGACG